MKDVVREEIDEKRSMNRCGIGYYYVTSSYWLT
jgi:hypothetical protein